MFNGRDGNARTAIRRSVASREYAEEPLEHAGQGGLACIAYRISDAADGLARPLQPQRNGVHAYPPPVRTGRLPNRRCKRAMEMMMGYVELPRDGANIVYSTIVDARLY